MQATKGDENMQSVKRMLRLRRRLILALAVAAGAGVLATGAISAVTSQTIIADTDSVHLRVVRTDANGFDSGWHVHPGVAIVQVQDGTFQIYQGSCSPTTVGPGQTFIEVPHLAVRAIASGHVAWTTTLITSSPDLPQIPASSYYGTPSFNPCPSLP
jgi:hypothetical protein